MLPLFSLPAEEGVRGDREGMRGEPKGSDEALEKVSIPPLDKWDASVFRGFITAGGVGEPPCSGDHIITIDAAPDSST